MMSKPTLTLAFLTTVTYALPSADLNDRSLFCPVGSVYNLLTGKCVDLLNDASNCGSLGFLCNTLSLGTSTCVSGQCVYTCNAGYSYNSATHTCVNLLNDLGNCGALNVVCPTISLGTTTCVQGRCTYACNSGYLFNSLTSQCQLSGSQKTRLRSKRGTSEAHLCPYSEEACPVAGSASYTSFNELLGQQRSAESLLSGIRSGSLGYECIDTTSSIESCGGCASTGAGVDCTSISHARGVGCQAGSCVVLQCAKGYKPSTNGSACVRTKSSRSGQTVHR